MKTISLFRQKSFCFRRFSRAAYAVFSSLHRQVTIGTLHSRVANSQMRKSNVSELQTIQHIGNGRTFSLLLLLLTLSASLFANATTGTDTLCAEYTHQLDEVAVTATPTRVASSKLHVVATISRQEIEALTAQNLSDILENIPSLDLRTRSSNGVQADLTMRGGTFDQVAVLLNGINITDPQTGHFNLEIPIDIALIDRIEILQGSSVSIFGLSAFSGAINIITGTSAINHTSASISAGDYGFINAALSANYSVKKWILTGSASYNRSEGYIANTDYQYANLMANVSCQDSLSGNWRIQLGGQAKEYGANSFYTLAYPNQFECNKSLLGSLTWDRRFGDFAVEVSMYGRIHSNHYELIRDFIDAPDWYTSHNNHLTTTAAINAKSAWYSTIGKTAIGIEVRNENIISNVLGDTLTKPLPIVGEQGNAMYQYGKNRLNVNYFAEQTFLYRHFSASAGISANYNTMFSHNFAFGVNIGYEYITGGNIFASVSRSLRLPTFTDLYYHSATQIPNPNLHPEKNLTTEIGISYNNYGVSTHLSAYYRIGQDIIDWVCLPSEIQWRAQNHSRVDATGGEIAIAYSHGYWLKKAEATYSYCHLFKNSGNYLSRYALDYLRHKFTLSVHHGIYRGFGASWSLSYQARNGEYHNTLGNITPYSPIWLLDGRIYWEGAKIRLFIEATNITNRHYYDYGGILQAGIWAKGGINVKI